MSVIIVNLMHPTMTINVQHYMMPNHKMHFCVDALNDVRLILTSTSCYKAMLEQRPDLVTPVFIHDILFILLNYFLLSVLRDRIKFNGRIYDQKLSCM